MKSNNNNENHNILDKDNNIYNNENDYNIYEWKNKIPSKIIYNILYRYI